MCGIVGVYASDPFSSPGVPRKLIESLLKAAESRGKEAAGIAVQTTTEMRVYKAAVRASRMLAEPGYRRLWMQMRTEGSSVQAVIGHSRLVTNGSEEVPANNQPVVRDGIAVIHNGIITNVDELWRRYPRLSRMAEVDTEILPVLLHHFLEVCDDIPGAVRRLFAEIEGTASFAALFADRDCLLLATNNGSLYVAESPRFPGLFGSERALVERCLPRGHPSGCVRQIEAGQCVIKALGRRPDDTISSAVTGSWLSPGVERRTREEPQCGTQNPYTTPAKIHFHAADWKRFEVDFEQIRALKRCSRGVLPETMPFIQFDDRGESNYAREYRRQTVAGKAALQARLDQLGAHNGSKVLVAFSGGRDSSYALYYLKVELGLDVVAYTYDWGMITDLARRNQARLCGKLGIEHIIVSADIAQKRNNIRKNVIAWLKRPRLGMVPIFMAGDKQYFYHANRLRRETGAAAIVLAANPLEKTHFKAGFCGVAPSFSNRPPFSSQLVMLGYYTREFLRNPAYLNSSLADTAGAFLSYYTIPHDYLRIFDYLRWDEREIDEILQREFSWEHANDTQSTWRIGDGTAAFYNYIFLRVAGFSENDTLRNNQVMEGDLSRAAALESIECDNQPRFESIQWYCRMLGLDPAEVLMRISSIPRLYGEGALEDPH
jgi:GNAT superfamily N-acetyltransferase